MSYILDALKKLEQRRPTEEVSDLLMLTVGNRQEPRSRPLWPYFLLAALLLNAGMLLFWIGGRQPEQRQVSAKAREVPDTTQVTHREDPVEGQGPVMPKTAGEAVQPKEPERPVARVGTGRDLVLPAPVGREAPVPDRPSLSHGARKEGVPPGGRATVSLNEVLLPTSTDLPKLKVSLHSYSPDPGLRVVRVNDMTLREGETLPPGLKVVEITPGEIIFSYQGRQFRVAVNGQQ